MIEIRLSDDAFSHDIAPLTRAFFPHEEVKCVTVPYAEPTAVPDSIKERENLPRFIVLTADTGDKLIKIWLSDERGRVVRGERVPTVTRPETDNDRDEAFLAGKRQYKNELKQVLYGILCDYTGRELPWGSLTGIRPVKLALDEIEAGASEESVRAFYKEEYLCSDEKTDLTLRIAKKEADLLSRIDYKNGYSIYIGIPFCPSTCLYCSFTSYPIGTYRKHVDEYLAALFKEIDFIAAAMAGKRLSTVYIGGGTPTALDEDHLLRLLDYINNTLPMDEAFEFTVESGRPDSITPGKLSVMKKMGVTRMSINPQTMSDKTLRFIGRLHTAEQTVKAFHEAREAGMDDINMDLIIGLPGESADDTRHTLSEIEKLNPDDLTVHSLAIKRAARLKLHLDEIEDVMPTDTMEMQRLTYEYAISHGYEPYYLYRQKNITENLENTGYARPGKEGIYNILMMEEKHTVVGLGAGSSCKFVFKDGKRIERTENVKFVMDYIGRIDEMIDRKKQFLDEFGEEL